MGRFIPRLYLAEILLLSKLNIDAWRFRNSLSLIYTALN